jgi:hypothetical protein
MKHNFENISKKTENVRLTSAEKLDMLSNLREYAASKPVPIPSPYELVWFRQLSMYATAFALIVGSGFTSYAAEGALPGDALYGIKTNVNEGVVRILPLSTTTKAKVEISMIDRRMEELEKMIVTDIDTPEKVDIIMEQIEEHKEEFDTHLAVLSVEVKPEHADEIHAELETVVDAHIAVLEEITLGDELVTEIADAPVSEQVDLPGTEVDAPVSDETYATGPVSDDSAVTMMVQLKTSVHTVGESGPTTTERAAPVQVRKVDPIVEEVTQFAESEVKPFAQRLRGLNATSSELREVRAELRERIFRNAEERLNIDIDVSVEVGDDSSVNGGI